MPLSLADAADFQAFLDRKYDQGRTLVPNPSREERGKAPRIPAKKAYFHPEFRKKEEALWRDQREEERKSRTSALERAGEHMAQALQQVKLAMDALPRVKGSSFQPPGRGSGDAHMLELRRIGQDVERRLLHLLARMKS